MANEFEWNVHVWCSNVRLCSQPPFHNKVTLGLIAPSLADALVTGENNVAASQLTPSPVTAHDFFASGLRMQLSAQTMIMSFPSVATSQRPYRLGMCNCACM
jgi:hypothetical protein